MPSRCFGRIGTWPASTDSSGAYAFLSFSTAWFWLTVTLSIVLVRVPLAVARLVGAIAVSKLNFTSSPVTGWPSCHFTPGRSAKV